MINFEDYENEKRPYIPDHPYRILIIGGSGSGKTNALLNLMENQPDIDKIYLYAKDRYEAKYQYSINIRESVGLNRFNDPKAFFRIIDPLMILNIQMICKMFIKIFMNIILNIQMICKMFTKILVNAILNIQMICKMFTKILMNAMQIKNGRY